MRKTLLALTLTLPVLAAAQQPCFGPGGCPVCPEGQVWQDCSGTSAGPGPCVPGCVGTPVAGPTAPGELCLRDQCQPVAYGWLGDLAVAQSRLPNGYAVMGWAGPCLHADRSQCPDIFNQAFGDARLNALRANRAQEAAP